MTCYPLTIQDKCVVEGVDSVMMHEIVLGGHLYLQLLKEKLELFLQVRFLSFQMESYLLSVSPMASDYFIS